MSVAKELNRARSQRAPMTGDRPWHGQCSLQLISKTATDDLQSRLTVHQSQCTAPFKIQRANLDHDGRCQLPLLHTAGGLVGGDQLSVTIKAGADSRGLVTSVAAQKVYGSVGRSKQHPKGRWASQECHFELETNADLEWLPQELVVFQGGLYKQRMQVELQPKASFLSAEVVRLGRTAAGETLNEGCWRSSLEICRQTPIGRQWELVDQLELNSDVLQNLHGMGTQPVFGSFVWAAPNPLTADVMEILLRNCRTDRANLEGSMACGGLDQGLVARYIGPSSQAARQWFSRLWARTRQLRRLSTPQPPREWPLQEEGTFSNERFTKNHQSPSASPH